MYKRQEHACVGSWIAARCSAYRALVYIHHLVDILDTSDALVWHRFLERTVEMLREDRLEMCIRDRSRTVTIRQTAISRIGI